ncbi:hypothetical protein R5R35_010512 [Gryllus longicercus]|uniref:Cytochrome P450 n=1 Tax=Gryllus longicercus TaxID=2509291 RepID=A0AAN9Z3R8_9ORTH
MSLLLVVAAALLAVALGALYTRRLRFRRAVDRLPGPAPLPLLGNALDLLVPRNRVMQVLEDRYQKYKPLYRAWIGPIAEIHLTLPEHVEVIMSTPKFLQKSHAYKFLHPWLGEGLLTSTGGKWHTHRKMITPTFHFKILDGFLDVFVEKSEILTKKLMAVAGGDSFDVYPYITHCALDIICETAMGTQIGAQDQKQSEYVKAIYEISELTLQRAMRPWLHPDVIFYRTDRGRRYRRCLQVLHGFTTKVIQERREALRDAGSNAPGGDGAADDQDDFLGKKKRLAFLDLLLEASENGTKLSDQDIREEVDTFMFEGHDTTTAGICWSLLLLGEHQDVQAKVAEELDAIFDGSERAATMRDVQEMKYLERVVKEALRLYPSVPFVGRALPEDAHVAGHVLPAGAVVNLHIFHVHRDARNWPDPERFDPDRFLPENARGRHPYAYIPFSAGPRNCVGQKFALLEEKTLLSAVLRKFHVHTTEKRDALTLMNELILRPESGIQLQLTPRH